MPRNPGDKTVTLQSAINLSTQEVVTQRVFDDPFADFKVYLELAGFMAFRYMEFSEKDPEDVSEFAESYILKCIHGYRDNKLKKKNEKSN